MNTIHNLIADQAQLAPQAVGQAGTKSECLAYIEEIWTDMRPLSLRKKMEENKGK